MHCTYQKTHTHAQTHTNAVLVTINDHILSIQPKQTHGLCVKIRKSIALEHETVDALSFIITLQILVCDECRWNREQLAHVLVDALNDWKLPNDAVEHDFNPVNKLQANRAWITFQTNCCWLRLFMGDEWPKYTLRIQVIATFRRLISHTNSECDKRNLFNSVTTLFLH